MHYTSPIEQCIKWNAKRYKRIYHDDLTNLLLLEEAAELAEANNLLDILDACGDITFVAVGALWKLGFSKQELENLFIKTQLSGKPIWEVTGILLAATEDLLGSKTLRLSVNKALLQDKVGNILGFILGVLTQLDKLNLQHEFINILKAICDSNDTKEVKGITDPSVKANIVKGEQYKPPTDDLIKICEANNKEYS